MPQLCLFSFRKMLKVKREFVGTKVLAGKEKSVVLTNDTPQGDLEWVYGLGKSYQACFEPKTEPAAVVETDVKLKTPKA